MNDVYLNNRVHAITTGRVISNKVIKAVKIALKVSTKPLDKRDRNIRHQKEEFLVQTKTKTTVISAGVAHANPTASIMKTTT
jgi:hypothetical protein